MRFWSWKRSIVCSAPLASALCSCPPHRWWPAASSAWTPWGPSTTSLTQISFKTRFCRRASCYLFLGLVILDPLAKFHQNCSNSSGVLRLFSSKDPQLPIFYCKNSGKKRFSLRTAKIINISPRAGHTHNKNTGTQLIYFQNKIFFSQAYLLIFAKKLTKKL